MGLFTKIAESIAYGVGYAYGKTKSKLRKSFGKSKNGSSSNSSSNQSTKEEYYEYETPTVTEAQVRGEMNCVCKYATDNPIVRVNLTSYTITKTYDGFDIDVYFEAVPYSNDLEEHTIIVSTQYCAERIMSDIESRMSRLGCGFRIIPHI